MANTAIIENTTTRPINTYPDLLDVKDIQEILHIGRSTAYKLLQSGELSSLRIGSIYRIPKVYLMEFIGVNA